MSDNFDETKPFTVNYSHVANSSELLHITRRLASSFISNPYISVGTFFKNISQEDFDSIIEVIEEGPDNPNVGDLMLISEMLAVGEGLDGGNVETIENRVNQFLVLVACESLYRKGLVKIYHDNMSFGEDAGDKIIVEQYED
jgi:hypothetical protein